MLRWYLVVAIAGAAACSDDPIEATPDAAGTPSIAGTPLSTFVGTSCSTGDVLALATQIADEVTCASPGALVAFEAGPAIEFTGSAVLPYLGEAARAALYEAAAEANGRTIRVTSAFRTVVQQYLLFRWFQQGRCGITAAADPGDSNHESGRALDVSNHSEWITTLGAHGWSHDVPGDPVHFDHLASADIRGADVLAFQRLWNRNTPAADHIAEDGAYGPMTEAAILRAPAEGFGIGASCATRTIPRMAPHGIEETSCAH